MDVVLQYSRKYWSQPNNKVDEDEGKEILCYIIHCEDTPPRIDKAKMQKLGIPPGPILGIHSLILCIYSLKLIQF